MQPNPMYFFPFGKLGFEYATISSPSLANLLDFYLVYAPSDRSTSTFQGSRRMWDRVMGKISFGLSLLECP